MSIKIRKLSPDLAEDYVHFFDTTPHDDNIDEAKCYCVCWCNDNYEGKDFSTPAKRKAAAFRYIKDGNIQGYLAYSSGKVVGWCNANTKLDCLQCYSWRTYMGHVPIGEQKIKSIFCFVIAPEMKRKGIATQLMLQVCQDAARDGFDFIEVYPNRNSVDDAAHFAGPLSMYQKSGFSVFFETEQGLVMRKPLQ